MSITQLGTHNGPIGSDEVQAMPSRRSHVYRYRVLLNGAATLTAAYELGNAKNAINTSPNKNIKLKCGSIASWTKDQVAQLRELRSRKRIPLN